MTRVIAVTGLTGFLGHHLQNRLLKQHFSTHALVRPGYDAKLLDPQITVHKVALDDVAGLTLALRGVGSVMHLAGTVRGCDSRDFRLANIDAVECLCQAIEAQAVPPSLLLISSLAAQQPSLSDYSASKFSGEQALRQYTGINWTIIRPPAIYGPGDREMMPLLRWLRRGLTIIPGNKDQRLGLLHVDDVTRAIIQWLFHTEQCRQQIFELDDGTPDGYDWEAIAAAAGNGKNRTIVLPVRLLENLGLINSFMARVFSYAPMLTPGKVRELTHDRWIGDNEPFTKLTSWQPRYNLESGVDHTFANL